MSICRTQVYNQLVYYYFLGKQDSEHTSEETTCPYIIMYVYLYYFVV